MHTPLDEPEGFTPAEDERPAGTWMEGYWKEIAAWTTRFSWIILVYATWISYTYVRTFSTLYQSRGLDIAGAIIMPAVIYAPIVFLGYFCLQTGRNLSNALKYGNQLYLEFAFIYLRRFLITGLVIAAVWMVVAGNEWRALLNLLNSFSSNTAVDPLLSE